MVGTLEVAWFSTAPGYRLLVVRLLSRGDRLP
jgi:hypothetical protein